MLTNPDPDPDFEAFAAARWPTMVRAAALMGLSWPDAEDVAQDTLIRCQRYWRRVRQSQSVDAYAFKILKNEINRSMKKHKSASILKTPDLNVNTRDVYAEFLSHEALMESLRRLTPDARAVIVLRHFVDLTEAEVANILNVPIGTVKSRLSRAHNKLADLISHVQEG